MSLTSSDSTSATPKAVTLIHHFKGFELRVQTRELLGAHKAAELEPRAFDLLVCLIENRDRVVTKDELLDRIWKTSHVSESVLARAIMKLRKALHGVDVDPDIIKTVHRIGYRFQGEPMSSRQGHGTVALETARVALLPLVNETGDPMLDWVELGLNTIVARRMVENFNIAMIPIESVLTVLTSLPPRQNPDRTTDLVRQALGAEIIIHTTIRRGGEGYLLEWQLAHGADHPWRRASLSGTQLTALALKFSDELARIIKPEAELSGERALSADAEFAAAAHARALSAYIKHDPLRALALIHICLDLPPVTSAVLVDHILILSLVDAAKGAQLGVDLLASEGTELSRRDRATLMVGLANCYMSMRDWELCERYADEVDGLLHPDRDRELIDNVRVLRFELALERGEINLARHVCRTMLEVAHHEHNNVDIAGSLSNLGKLELARGDWDQGCAFMEEAFAICRRFDFSVILGTGLNNFALTSMWRGRVEEAVDMLTRSIAACEKSDHPAALAAAHINLYTAHCELGDKDQALQHLAAASPSITRAGSGLLALSGFFVDAEIRYGELNRAEEQARAALQKLAEIPGLHRNFGQHVIGLIAAGSLDEAAITLAAADHYQTPAASQAHLNYLAACAQLAYARHDHLAAHQWLMKYVDLSGSLVASFDGATNLLWVELDLGELMRAKDIAAAIPDHLTNTVRGKLCAARLAYASGEAERAVSLQSALLEKFEGRRGRPYAEALLDFYRQGPRGSRRRKFPGFGLLPSLL